MEMFYKNLIQMPKTFRHFIARSFHQLLEDKKELTIYACFKKLFRRVPDWRAVQKTTLSFLPSFLG